MQRNKLFSFFCKTLKSYNRREEMLSILFLVVLLVTGGMLVFPSRAAIREPVNENMVYREGMVGKIELLNPLFTDFNPIDQDISGLIFSGLSKYDPVQKRVVEDIATHYLSEDRTVYTFILKDNVFWHDGAAVTSEDIYFTYAEVIQHPDFSNPVLRANFSGVEIKKVDDKMVTFRLNEPNSFFFTSTTVGLIPAHILRGVPISELIRHPFNQNPIGTGAYRVKEPLEVSSNDESEVQLTLFDKYYGKMPSIKHISFHAYATLDDLLSNKAMFHALARLSAYDLNDELLLDKRLFVYDYTLPQFAAVFINTDDAILKDYNVRLALLKSIDKSAGLNSLISELRGKKRVDTLIMDVDDSDWLFAFNKTEAMGALYDGKWRFSEKSDALASQVRQNSKGEPLKLVISAPFFDNSEYKADEQQKTLAYLERTWESVGFDISFEVIQNPDEFRQKLFNKQYQLLLYGQHMGYNIDMYAYWHSSQAGQTGLNLSNYRNLKADHVIESLRLIYNQADRIESFRNLGDIISSDMPVIPLHTPIYYYLVDKRVQNVNLGALVFQSDRLTTLSNWAIK